MTRIFLVLTTLVLSAQLSFAAEPIEPGEEWAEKYVGEMMSGKLKNVNPSHGFVPDNETAISIAVSVWAPIYGKEKIEKESPYYAYLVDGLWVVTGSIPKGNVGGTAKAIISKDTGEILHVIHYK